MMKQIIFSIVLFLAASFFVFNLIRLIKKIRIGKKEDSRLNNFLHRFERVLVVAFGQSKLFRDFPAGLLHFFIFWGFVLFLFAVIESLIQGLIPNFSLAFLKGFYTVITLIQDIFGALVIISVVFALYRRFILKIPRLIVNKAGQQDALLILIMILFVVLFMFGQNVSLVAMQNNTLNEFEVRPISAALSGLFLTDNSHLASNLFEVFWWGHIIMVLAFMNYLPYSKHLHVLTSIPNTFFANLEPDRTSIKKLNLDDDTKENFGAGDVEHLSWKQILDGYTCTECGRCTDACPASNAGKTLSPRKIIMDIRHRNEDKSNGKDEILVHNYISDEELWQCTTCMACVQECPVMIEHLDSIIDMRRYLVLTESEFPSELNTTFNNLETKFTPWSFNPSDRAAWTEGLNIKTMAEDPNHDILFWVGCAGSFDERYKKVSRAFAQLLQKAGINFRILGEEEKCNGDTARRLGNEYLAQTLMNENIETFKKYNIKRVVTACPHCFQSLGKEYKQMGLDLEVLHHSYLIDALLHSGKIELKKHKQTARVTYHDSCYLGRYNNLYQAPRETITTSGFELVEPKQTMDKGFCCGAGGGRMFLEDVEGQRINEIRTQQLLDTNPDSVATACPFCMTMISDGVKHFNKVNEVAVKDIAELVFENSK